MQPTGGAGFKSSGLTERFDLLDSGTAVALAGGGNTARPLVRVTAYHSYYLRINANVNGAPAAFDPISAVIVFQDLNGTIVYKDSAEYWANAIAPFAVSFGNFFVQDQIHGPNMFIVLVNGSGDPMLIDYSLFGSTRDFNGPVLKHHENKGQDGILLSSATTIPAAGSTTLPAGFGYGRAWTRLSTGGAAMTLTVTYGTGAGPLSLTGPGAGASVVQEIVIPKRAPRFTIAGTVGDAYNFYVGQQLYPA